MHKILYALVHNLRTQKAHGLGTMLEVRAQFPISYAGLSARKGCARPFQTDCDLATLQERPQPLTTQSRPTVGAYILPLLGGMLLCSTGSKPAHLLLWIMRPKTKLYGTSTSWYHRLPSTMYNKTCCGERILFLAASAGDGRGLPKCSI